MILTFTANPALDVTYSVPTFRLGSSHRVDPPQVRAGGKGVNVARVLHEQGRTTCVIAPAGGGPGVRFRTDLDAAGLRHHLVEVAADTRTTLALVGEDTTNINESGSPLSPAEWAALSGAVAAELGAPAGPGVVLVCSGSTPPHTPLDLFPGLVEAAHAAGATAIVDTSGPHLLAAADAGADVLKPNDEEILAALGGTDPIVAARRLAARSGGLVLLSMGPDGLAAVRDDGPCLHARPGRRLRGNTTGAGDAAVAATAAAIAADPDALTTGLDELLRQAVAWSGAAVLAPLAGSITDPTPLLPGISITEF
ncbi:1-phosphofructokinase family hexose kinase [Pseudactinotalea sp. HY160]|uniref:1-phosphofructokinase family hexose kinase n=1 Tax=Pseudactinotalea sp. HY160 TaxID=2654490 RepID=UPI00128D2066|nr:PfkB family carbohydrate kinase [Pseudactinotalea sp. HY160]MPV51072.1 1-phosphofructokinase family hexose kinase [Pseudactinotalea sp. HY160]